MNYKEFQLREQAFKLADATGKQTTAFKTNRKADSSHTVSFILTSEILKENKLFVKKRSAAIFPCHSLLLR